MKYSEDLSKLSEDSYHVIFESRNNKDKAGNSTARSSQITDDERPYSIRSSIDVPNVNHQESILMMSHKEHPPLQTMDRPSSAYVGSSSSVFTANSTPQEWSLVSNESLFSLQEDHVSYDNRDFVMERISSCDSSDFSLSEEVMSDRPSTQSETARSAFDGDVKEDVSSMSDYSSREFIVQKTNDDHHEETCIPEVHWGSRKGKIQTLPSLVVKKPEKIASDCTDWSCCRPSCSGLSTCFYTKDFPYFCKMPNCSCCCKCNSCLGWWCDWIRCCFCFPKRTCCPNWNSFSCNWRCWRLWNCCCCYKGSVFRSWNCCWCCNSWNNCHPKASWCKSLRCSTCTCWCSRTSTL